MAAEEHLDRGMILMAEDDFTGARKEYEEVLRISNEPPFADEALFRLGIIAVYHGNEQREYEKAKAFFQRLLNEYPQSTLSPETKAWLGVLTGFDKPPVIIEATQKKIRKDVRPSHQQKTNMQTINDFESALRKNKEWAERSGKTPPADQALFQIGLILVNGKNPNKDYSQARSHFARLVRDFPESPYREEAEIWTNVLDVIEKATQIDIEIEKKRKEFSEYSNSHSK